MTRIIVCLLGLLSFSGYLKAQTVESGNLFSKIETILAGMPASNSDNYLEPDAGQLTTWNKTIDYLLAGNYGLAATEANSIDYDLIEFTDTPSGKKYYVLTNNKSNYWGTYVFYPEALRPLVIQSPHPKYDTNTGLEGIFIFQETDALFFSMSGTHRCNQGIASSCSGTTSVCGTTEPYKISDMAHSVSSIFQAVTDNLYTQIDTTYFVSLHGFGKRDSDPYVILSNGTRETPETDYISRFKNNLLQEDGSLTFQLAHINTNWNRLIAFTNTQGRLINNSIDPCEENASTVTGRFMHIEQEKSKLRNDEDGWQKVANALKKTFSGPVLAINVPTEELFDLYPNPSTGQIFINAPDDELEHLAIYDLLNKEVINYSSERLPESSRLRLDLVNLPNGTYILRLKSTVRKIIIQ